MNPAIGPAVETVTKSTQFSDLEKLLFLLLIGLVALAVVGVAWVAKRVDGKVDGAFRDLIAEVKNLSAAFMSSDAKHAARADEIKQEVRGVGAKVDSLAVEVRTLDKSVGDLGGRVSGAEDALQQTRLDLRNGIVPPDPEPRAPTGAKLRAVRG